MLIQRGQTSHQVRDTDKRPNLRESYISKEKLTDTSEQFCFSGNIFVLPLLSE